KDARRGGEAVRLYVGAEGVGRLYGRLPAARGRPQDRVLEAGAVTHDGGFDARVRRTRPVCRAARGLASPLYDKNRARFMSETKTKDTFEFVRDNIAQTPFHQWLLPRLMAVDEKVGSVTIHLSVRPELCRVSGRPEVHGGVIAALVDITGHAAIAA